VTNNGVSLPTRHPRTHSDLPSETFGIQGPEAYAYTSLSNCLDVPGIDDVKDFEETLVSSACHSSSQSSLTLSTSQRAMQIVGLTQHEQTEVFRMLAIILWLGNIQFAEDDSGNSVISDTNVTDFVAYLMEVDPAVVQKAMTIKVVETQRGGRRGLYMMSR
jgi:myosin-1